MRHGSSRRQRNNRSNRRGNNNRSQVFDSNGPDVRIRGTAYQVAEKYEVLAKDAEAGGDRILAESYLQHAEHYLRIISNWNQQDKEGQSGGNQKSHSSHHTKHSSTNNTKGDDLGLPSSILNAGSSGNLEDA